MPSSHKKTRNTKNDNTPFGAESEINIKRSAPKAVLPDESFILEEKQFESPTGRRYKIVKTSQIDQYEDVTPDGDE